MINKSWLIKLFRKPEVEKRLQTELKIHRIEDAQTNESLMHKLRLNKESNDKHKATEIAVYINNSHLSFHKVNTTSLFRFFRFNSQCMFNLI